MVSPNSIHSRAGHHGVVIYSVLACRACCARLDRRQPLPLKFVGEPEAEASGLHGFHRDLSLLNISEAASWAQQSSGRGPPTSSEPDDATENHSEVQLPIPLDPEQIRDQVSRNMRAPTKVIDMIEGDWMLLSNALLAGFHPPFRTVIVWITTLCLAILWFVFYFKGMYCSDCASASVRWESQLGEGEDMLTPGRPASVPDVVMCFHHPAQPHKDDKRKIESKLVDSVVSSGHLPIEIHQSRSVSHIASDTDDSPKEVDMATAREMMLKAIVRLLPRKGFNVEVWASAGKDTIFVGASLRSGKATLAYLYKYQFDLMLRPNFIRDTLRIKHPPREAASAPPFVTYDPYHVMVLSQASLAEAADSIYQTYNDQGSKHTLASSRVRVLAIQHELANSIDIQSALKLGLVSEFYPVHNPAWIQMMRAHWGSAREMIRLMEPLPLLREYFGERMAFDFAWTGTYCKSIMPLALFSIATFVARRSSWALGLGIFNDRQIISGSIVILLWGAVAHNLWIREKLFFAELWDTEGHSREKTSRTRLTRPEFIGEEGPSVADNSAMDLHFPKSWWLNLTARKLIAFFVTVQLCVCVATYVLTLVESRRGNFSLLDTMMLSGFIKLSELVFTQIAAVLTEWENHKHQDNFYNSLAIKTFLFQFVNYYWWFVCLCFYQKLKGFCPATGCFETLQQQLRRVVLFNLAYSAGEQVAYHLLVRMQVWWTGGWSSVSSAEKQSKYMKVSSREHIDSMMQRVMALGYIILFGAIEPLIVPAIWLMFVFHLRMEAWLTTTSKQRPWPTTASGIGAWQEATEFMLTVSTISSACIVVTYGELFSGASTIARVTFVIMWMLGVYAMRGVVNAVLPSRKEATETLAARLAATKQKLFELVRGQECIDDLESVMSPMRGAAAEHISENVRRAQNGRWSEITTLIGDAPP